MKACWCGNTALREYSDEYLRCDVCGTLVSRRDISYDANDISDENDFYGEAYWSKKMLAAANKNTLSELVDFYLQERCVYWLTSLFRYRLPGQGAIAEVGCGLGQFSYLLKQCGYSQTAFEISPQICKYIQNTLNVNVICGEFKEIESQRYDAVVAFDVLEHFTAPHHFLETVSHALNDNGILMLQTPVYDEKLTHSQMLQQKARFAEQMKDKEHVYLYSKSAVEHLLMKHGFQHIQFLDAFFGNDYDMFLVASRKPIHTYDKQTIDQQLERQSAGRLVKAQIALWNETRKQSEEIAELHEQWNQHLEQINWLTEQLKTMSVDHENRLQLINQLSEKLETTEKKNSLLQEKINQLTEMLEISEKDRQARLDKINQLTEILETSEKDRQARLAQINTLTKMIRSKDRNL